MLFKDKKAAAAVLAKKGAAAGAKNEDHAILEGISSLHSWIKSQTMIRPQGKGEKDMKTSVVTAQMRQYMEDDVIIHKLFFV